MAELLRDTIDGDGVRLREPRHGDIDDIVAAGIDDVVAAGIDPVMRRFVGEGLPGPYPPADADDWLGTHMRETWARGGAVFVVADPATDRLLGMIGLAGVRSEGSAVDIAGWIAPQARRKGAGTAAIGALSAWAFSQGISRIELHTHKTNEAGQRVALAAGFTHEGVRRAASEPRDGTRTDMVIWTRLADDPAGPTGRALPDLPDGQLSDGTVMLTPLRAGDTDDMFALLTLPEVLATTVSPVLPTRASTAARCAEAMYPWLIGTRAEFVIRDVPTGAFVGEIGLYYEPLVRQAMIGYSMTREWRGRGLATRAARLVADWAFDAVGVARLIAGAAPDNIGSQRVLERAGFTREAYERERLPGRNGTRVDNISYAFLPGDRPA